MNVEFLCVLMPDDMVGGEPPAAPSSVPPNALLDVNGNPILDANGNYILV